MAGEGAGAELRLRVSLDLTSLRRQLATIGTQLAGQALPLQVRFDRTSISKEFRLLNRYIGGKKFNIEINTNLKTELDRARQLAEAIKAIPGGGGAMRAPGTVEQGFSQAQLRKLRQDIKPLYKAAATAGLVVFEEAIANNTKRIAKELSGVGKSSIAGLLNGLKSGDPQLEAAAKSLGKILINTIKAVLGIASPSKETGKLGKFAGQGFEKGFISAIVKAERTMANAIRAAVIGSIREGLSNLPGLGGALVGFERQLAASVQLAVRRAMRDGMRASIAPGAKGTLLGGAGGATTGAVVGGAKALGGGIAGGVAKLTAGGLMGTAANLARYSLDSSAYQEFVGKLYQEIINSALSSGTQGAVIGALAVGGVAGGLGFARGATGSLVLQAATAIRNRILAALLAVSTGDLNNIVKVMVRDVTGALFTNTIRQLRSASLGLPKINWPAIAPASTVGIGPSSSGRLLPAGADPRMLGAAAPPAGLLPGISQTTARRSSIATGLEAIFAAGGPTFPDEPPGKLALTPEALKRRVDAILAEYFKTVEVEVREVFDGPVLKKALTVFSYLAQALQDAEKRARGLLGSFGRERTYTGRLAVDPQVSSRPYQRLLPPAITKLLSAGRETITGVGAQEQVVRNFYKQLRESAQMFAENFSANSYLPQATRKLAGAMEGAAITLKALSAGRVAGALPSREMLDARKFASAIQKAIVIDMQNALATQMSGRLLPAAGGTRGFQRMMEGTPTFRAPDVGPGRSKPDVSGKVLPVEDIIKFKAAIQEAAIIDARNAARAALKSIRREMFRALLPAAGMTGRARQAPPVAGIFATEARETERQFGTLRYSLAQAMPALPPAGMTGLGAAQAARVQQAYARSAARGAAVMGGARTVFPTSGMIYPSSPLGKVTAQSTMFAASGAPPGGGIPPRGGGGMLGGGNFARAFGNINLPGQGVIRELGEEFGFAAKQVLLFGTAYKALAFIQGFPNQVAQAVSQLQSFRNTLDTISPTAQEAAASNNLILSLVEKYNIPLQSARDGFTKLYASMQPAGFSGDQVRNLFTGVSKAAATFGMSADKIDRVNYAFAQMASKGQVMSEELKGQLGDVLPGAMAIFAQAAGFTGEQAINKFSVALEQGRYKGAAMMELLNNVSIVLNEKFTAGAEGAAKTFQGAINNMQTAFKGLYESFEPVAIEFLNGIVTPMMKGVKTITDGLNSFFNGTQTQTAGGFALAQELEKLRPSFEGIKKNAIDLAAVFGQFAKIALDLGRILLQIAGNPIAGYLLKIYAIMVPVNMALNVMRGLWALNGIQLLLFNARVATGTSTLTAFRGMMAATGATAATTAASIRTAGLTLRTFFATTGVGLVVAGISILIEQFLTLEQKLAAVREKALGAAQAIRAMSATEARAEEQRSTRAIKVLQSLGKRGPLYAGSDRVGLSESEAQLLESMAIPVAKGLGGGRSLPQTAIAGYQQRIETVNLAESKARQNQLKFEEQQANRPSQFAEIKGGGGDGASKSSQKAAKAAERLTEQIAQQAQAAADALFNEQQRLAIMQATDPTAKALTEYASQELVIERELNKALADAKSEKEKQDRLAEANIKRQANALTLDQQLADARKQAMQPLEDTLRNQREQLLVETDIKNLVAQGMVPERAKEVAEIRKLTRAALEQINSQIKALDNQIAITDAAILEREAREGSSKAVQELRNQLKKYEEEKKKRDEDRKRAEARGAEAEAGVPEAKPESYISKGYEDAMKNLKRLTDMGYQIVEAAGAIGDAFGTAFKQIITGSATVQEAFAGLFRSVADHFADMVAKMIAEWLKAQLIKGFMNIVSGLIPGAGMLGGLAGGAAGFGGSFNSGIAPLPNAPNYSNVFGISKFANGGIVTGPTLGLVGEGRYNEAIVPLPNGRSIPVDLGGASAATNVVINVDAKGTSVAGDQGSAQALARDLASVVDQRIIYHKRAGGLLSR